jgi:hypothetical protein
MSGLAQEFILFPPPHFPSHARFKLEMDRALPRTVRIPEVQECIEEDRLSAPWKVALQGAEDVRTHIIDGPLTTDVHLDSEVGVARVVWNSRGDVAWSSSPLPGSSALADSSGSASEQEKSEEPSGDAPAARKSKRSGKRPSARVRRRRRRQLEMLDGESNDDSIACGSLRGPPESSMLPGSSMGPISEVSHDTHGGSFISHPSSSFSDGHPPTRVVHPGAREEDKGPYLDTITASSDAGHAPSPSPTSIPIPFQTKIFKFSF